MNLVEQVLISKAEVGDAELRGALDKIVAGKLQELGGFTIESEPRR